MREWTSNLSYVSFNSWLQSILELLDVNLSHLFDNSDIESFIFILWLKNFYIAARDVWQKH